jgi:hypothetical protein
MLMLFAERQRMPLDRRSTPNQMMHLNPSHRSMVLLESHPENNHLEKIHQERREEKIVMDRTSKMIPLRKRIASRNPKETMKFLELTGQTKDLRQLVHACSRRRKNSML